MSSWNLDRIPGRQVTENGGGDEGFGVAIGAMEVGGFVEKRLGIAVVGFRVDYRIEKERTAY